MRIGRYNPQNIPSGHKQGGLMKTENDVAREEAKGKAMKKGGAIEKSFGGKISKDMHNLKVHGKSLPVKMAMGGIGKQRKGEMSKSGAPMAPKLPMKRGGAAKKK